MLDHGSTRAFMLAVLVMLANVVPSWTPETKRASKYSEAVPWFTVRRFSLSTLYDEAVRLVVLAVGHFDMTCVLEWAVMMLALKLGM